MHSYRAASKPGNVRAPSDFIEQLRKDTGNRDLDCWWEPTCNRDVPKMDGTKESRRGCWVVWQRIRVLHWSPLTRTTSVGVSMDKYVDVYKLDGEYNCPTVLGSWVAKVLNQADVTRRGNGRRAQELNDLNEADYLKQFEDSRKWSEEFTQDAFVKKVFAMDAEKNGRKTKTREDVNAELKVLLERQKRDWEQHVREAKTYRTYQDVAPGGRP